MSSQILFWVIAFVFFQPLHLGLPILYLFIYTQEQGRSVKVKKVLLLGIASSALLFIIAAWLSQEHLYLAIIVLVVSIPLPWLGLREKTA